MFGNSKAPKEMSWHRLEAVVKALRDLQEDQKLEGGQERPIRDAPLIKLLLHNYQAGMAQLKKK